MTRPLYENESDRRNESFFLFLFPDFVKVPKHYGFDFMDFKKHPTSIAELKTRHYASSDIPEGKLMLSYHKYMAMKAYADLGHVSTLYVLFNDGLYKIPSMKASKTEEHLDLSFMGRRDRNDTQDVEPCVLYNVHEFEKVYDNAQLAEKWREWNASKNSADVPSMRA